MQITKDFCKRQTVLCVTEILTPSTPSYSLCTCLASPPKSLSYHKCFKADPSVFDQAALVALSPGSWLFCPERKPSVTDRFQVYQICLKFTFGAEHSILKLQKACGAHRDAAPSPFQCNAGVSPCKT